MRLTDRRLYQAKNLEDFRFRLHYRDEDNRTRRGAARETVFYATGTFVPPDTNRIWGVDVSGRWDGLVDFSVTAAYGAKFSISKAVDGTAPTPYWKENNQSAYDAGLLNGSYGWLYPDKHINCTLQAQAYWDLIRDAGLRLPPAVDWEWTKFAGVQANPNYDDLRKWLAAFIRISGIKPILYTAAGYVALFGAVPADILAMLSGVWVASYGGTQPSMPKGITSWDMWQFTANGDALALAPGNQGKRELDLNYMTQDFYDRYAIIEPEVPGEIIMARYEATNLYPNMSLRAGHDTGAAFIKSFPTGTKWYGDVIWIATEDKWLGSVQINKVGDVWLQVSNVGGAPYVGWVAIIHLGKDWCNLTDNNPPQPPAETFPPRVGLTIGTETRYYVPE
jgi:GH25 family lysozyme M1 (1,4-beta-N-acetylmuramidase)